MHKESMTPFDTVTFARICEWVRWAGRRAIWVYLVGFVLYLFAHIYLADKAGRLASYVP